MAYEKQTWVDGVTQLDAEHMNHIEDGIAGMEQTPGADGGYYTPSVTQPDESTIKFAFAPSKDGMADVPDQSISLPSGAGGDGSFSDSAKIALLNCFEKVAWVDERGRVLCDTLKEALNIANSLDEYVADGLEMWFDGIKNTRIGHSSMLYAWEDLSGNDHDMRCAGNITGTSVKTAQCGHDHVCFDGSTIFYNNDEIASLLALNPGTLEIVFEQENSDKVQSIVTAYAYANENKQIRNKAIWYRPSSNGYRIFSSYGGATSSGFIMDDPTTKIGISVSYTDDDNYGVTVNGTAISDFTSGGTMPCNKTFAVGGKAYISGDLYGFTGKIYSIRYYNRVLTPDEIAQNLAVDRKRFDF